MPRGRILDYLMKKKGGVITNALDLSTLSNRQR